MWYRHPNRFYLFYLIFLYGLIVCYFFRWPIFGGDTDLWYHLNGGRYIAEHRALPTDSSFVSFLTPPRAWVDYYWLFQVLVYRLHLVLGYPGLIGLRNVVYLALITVILAHCCIAYRRGANKSPLYLTILFVLYTFFLFHRFIVVRPHIFSYLLIPAFLLIYEWYPHRAIWLPLLAILWCNLHGGEYPVMLLISGAYVLEFLVNRVMQRQEAPKATLAFLIPAVLSMWAIFATPHGSKLLTIPFSTAHTSQYILEYMPLTSEGLSTMLFATLTPTQQTLFNLLLATAGVGIVSLGFRGRLRISHLVMFAGGTFLFMKGVRFTYEFALLVLPILVASNPLPASSPGTRISRLSRITVRTFLIATPIAWMNATFAHPPRSPLSPRGLPQGVVTFLKHVRTPGAVLNHPNTGGYLQWMLYPTNKIFMDLQCPLLFTEEDLYTAENMYFSEEVLRKVFEKYDPSFLAVPIVYNQFRNLIHTFPDYVPVFFDDTEVLYMNQRHYPTLAKQYQLTALDPFALSKDGVASVVYRDDRQTTLAEARTLLEIYPDCFLLNQLVAATFNQEGTPDRALPLAENIIRNFPELRTGYGLKGDALQGLKLFHEALAAYRMALARSRDEPKAEIFLAMGYAYRALGQNIQAYQVFQKAVNPFSPDATAEGLYWLASSALLAGKTREGAMFLRFAAQKVSPNDATWYARLKELERSAVHIKSQ